LLILIFPESYKSVIYAIVFSTAFNTFLVVLFTKKTWRVQKRDIDKMLMYELIKFGIPLVPSAVISLCLNSLDKIGLRQWSTLEQLGLYAVAFKIVSIMGVLQNIFATAWIPVAYQWHENNESTEKFTSVGCLVLSVVAIVFAGIVISRDIIIWFLGTEYRNTSLIFYICYLYRLCLLSQKPQVLG
jgi:O-antigen/teichoic acid export membrane protein